MNGLHDHVYLLSLLLLALLAHCCLLLPTSMSLALGYRLLAFVLPTFDLSPLSLRLLGLSPECQLPPLERGQLGALSVQTRKRSLHHAQNCDTAGTGWAVLSTIIR